MLAVAEGEGFLMGMQGISNNASWPSVFTRSPGARRIFDGAAT